MLQSSSVSRSAGIFVLVYGLLLAPWPGWNDRYCAWLAGFGRAAFSWDSSRCIVRFDPAPRTPAQPLDLRIMVGNRALLDANLAGPASVMELDARGIGWVPTALLIALVLATPLPWLRRLRALTIALAGIHLYLLFVIGICLWNGVAASTSLQLLAPSPLTKAIAGALNQTLVLQMGTGFVVATFLWLLAVFGGTTSVSSATGDATVPDRTEPVPPSNKSKSPRSSPRSEASTSSPPRAAR